MLREEAERELREALAELPERTSTVLALRYFDNMEYHTIASTLGLSLGNVKTLIHRGKIALAKKMQERDARQRSSAKSKEARVRCSSCETMLDRYVEGTLGRARWRASRRICVRAHARRCLPNCASSMRCLQPQRRLSLPPISPLR